MTPVVDRHIPFGRTGARRRPARVAGAIRLLLGVAAIWTLGGCRQLWDVERLSWEDVSNDIGLETDRSIAPIDANRAASPRETADSRGDANRARAGSRRYSTAALRDRPLTLREALSIALENDRAVTVLDGGEVNTASATGYDPAIARQRIVTESSSFDPRIAWGVNGGKFDEPPEVSDSALRSSRLQRDELDMSVWLSRRWPTGAETRVGYEPPIGYRYLPASPNGVYSPTVGSGLVFEARQPLLSGAGVSVNVAPIRIARLRTEQSSLEFQAAVLAQVRSVEQSYWRLQASYVALGAVDQILKLLQEAVRVEEARLKGELVTRAEVARVRLQQHDFQARRVRIMADIQQDEYALRNLIGLPAQDGQRLVPVDQPLRQHLELDDQAILQTALAHRPDIQQRRMQLRIRQLEFDVAENARLPRMDLQTLFRAGGLDDRFKDALKQTVDFQYTDWTAGLVYSIPLGNRAARARRAAAEYAFARDRALFIQEIKNLDFRIRNLLRDLRATWREYELARKRIDESERWVRIARIRYTSPPRAGGRSRNGLMVALDDYQFALRENVAASIDASRFLAEYNSILAQLEELQGTLLESRAIDLLKHDGGADPNELLIIPPAPASEEPQRGTEGGGWSAPQPKKSGPPRKPAESTPNRSPPPKAPRPGPHQSNVDRTTRRAVYRSGAPRLFRRAGFQTPDRFHGGWTAPERVDSGPRRNR